LQLELAEENSQSLRSQMCYFECYKKLVHGDPKHFDKLKPEPGLTRKAWSDLQLCIGVESRIVESCK